MSRNRDRRERGRRRNQYWTEDGKIFVSQPAPNQNKKQPKYKVKAVSKQKMEAVAIEIFGGVCWSMGGSSADLHKD